MTATHETATASPVDVLAPLVGSTPLVEICYRYAGKPRRIFAKYEAMNMTGSTKDRMALHVLRDAYARGELRPGATIVEVSSGNTGISFAALGRALGHPVRIYMPSWMSPERRQLMETFGAEVRLVSRQHGGFCGALALAEEDGREQGDVFLPRQFDNAANVEAHATTTGPEIVAQLAAFGRSADAFVAGVGTGGTVMGVGACLRRERADARIHPLEPANSPTLRTGRHIGSHRIQGISDEFVPSIVHLDELDSVVDVWDGDAILMAQALSHELGLAVGISAGANVVGAMKVLERLDPDATVVTILPDSNKKYLSTALCHYEPMQPEYVTGKVELERFVAKR